MSIVEVDPFELPDWLGAEEVTWTAVQADGGLISGQFSAEDQTLQFDLFAVDRAYPMSALSDCWRQVVHRAWQHGQIALLEIDQRLTMGVPGTDVTAETALVAIGRFARSVGSSPARFVVALRAH